MHLRRLLFIAFLSFVFFPASGKQNKDLVRANYCYDHYAFYEAIPYFEKVADSVKSPVVYARLADCYSVTDNLQKAADTYLKAASLNGCGNDVLLKYAQLLMQLTQYGEAQKWLMKYRENDTTDTRAANLIAGCTMALNAAAATDGTLTLLSFNTDGSDFAPTMWNGMLVFASDTAINAKKKTDKWTGRSYYNLYGVPCDSYGQCDSVPTSIANTKDVNIKYHTGPCTFSSDGRTMYFTRSRYGGNFLGSKAVANKDSMVVLEIMIASDYDTAERKFRTVTPFAYNSKEYAVAHPAVSPDGRIMAFSSNMPKGHGRSDLYLCRNVNGRWRAPQNAGEIVNTEGDEQFPFWADDSTLFFSSDGHAGFGGLDIYQCRWNEKDGTFSKPVNAGRPVNSSYDDISMAIHAGGRRAYFSSNRPAPKGGDNIYFYERSFLQLNVYDSATRQPIPAASIALDMHDTITDNAGRFFTLLHPAPQYSLHIEKPDYFPQQITISGSDEKDTIVKAIYLVKVPHHDTMHIAPEIVSIKHMSIMDTPGVKVFQLDAIYEIGHFYYEYNSYELMESHRVFLDSLLAQLNRHPTMRIEIRAHTDCRGSVALNLTLSNNRALSVVSYLAKHGIARSRLEYKGLGSGMPIFKCPICEACTEEQHYLNRVLEFKVLQL